MLSIFQKMKFSTEEWADQWVRKLQGQDSAIWYLESQMFDPFPNKSWFLHVCSASPLKTLQEKEKLLVMNNFSFSPSVFYPFQKLSAIFIKFEIVVCKLFQFYRV